MISSELAEKWKLTVRFARESRWRALHGGRGAAPAFSKASNAMCGRISGFRASMWMSWHALGPRRTDSQPGFYGSGLHVAGRLKPGAVLGNANAEMANIARQLRKENPIDNYGMQLGLDSLFRLRLSEDESGRTMLLISGIVWFLFALAFTNFSALTLLRIFTRRRELRGQTGLGRHPGHISAVLAVGRSSPSISSPFARRQVTSWKPAFPGRAAPGSNSGTIGRHGQCRSRFPDRFDCDALRGRLRARRLAAFGPQCLPRRCAFGDQGNHLGAQAAVRHDRALRAPIRHRPLFALSMAVSFVDTLHYGRRPEVSLPDRKPPAHGCKSQRPGHARCAGHRFCRNLADDGAANSRRHRGRREQQPGLSPFFRRRWLSSM